MLRDSVVGKLMKVHLKNTIFVQRHKSTVSQLKRLETSRIWTIVLESSDDIHPDEYSPYVQTTVHELVEVEPFEVNPVTEMMWSIAALIGCFSLALVIPLTIYFAARAKEKREESVRKAALDKTIDSE